MSIQAYSGVSLHPIRLGDRGRTAPGWMIVAQGAVRGILGSGPDGQVLHACACDRRILPPNGLVVFEGLEEAQAWLDLLMPGQPPPEGSSPPDGEPEDDGPLPTAMTLADAEQALLAAAVDYCWSLRHRALPDRGPLRRLWTAFVEFRRLSGASARGTA